MIGMRRDLKRSADGWVLPFTTEQVAALGTEQTGGAVLVTVEDGTPARIVIRRVPTRAEATRDTLDQYTEALTLLAAAPVKASPVVTIDPDLSIVSSAAVKSPKRRLKFPHV